MKVIDLLNKIANGEEVPKKIKIGNKIYNYETFNIGKGDNYFTAEWGEVKGYRINYDGTYYYLEIRDYNLNDEVEIIEEKKIKRIQSCGNNLYSEYIGQWLVNKENYTEYDELLMNKINEIIDYLEENK